MEMPNWEEGARQLIPSVEEVLKNVLLKKIQVEMSASSITDPSMTIDALKTGTVVIQGTEETTESDLFIAYDENWIPQLSSAMLGVEESELNEITQDLIKEFSSQLVGALQVGLEQQGIVTQPSELSIVKSGQINKSIDSDSYFMVQLDVSGKFEIEGDEQPHMALILAFAVPDESAIENLKAGQDSGGETPAEETQPEAGEEQEAEAGAREEAQEEPQPEEPYAEEETQPAGAAETGAEAQAQQEQQTGQQQTRKRRSSPVEGKSVEFDKLSESPQAQKVENRNLDILKDVELDISVELGRKEVPLGEILHMVRGSVIELDKLAGEPVEIYANGHRIAEGEVVVIDENFGVRVTNLVSTKERIETLR